MFFSNLLLLFIYFNFNQFRENLFFFDCQQNTCFRPWNEERFYSLLILKFFFLNLFLNFCALSLKAKEKKTEIFSKVGQTEQAG